MFLNGEIIGDRYLVEDLCNDTGGMGALLYVKDISGEHNGEIVLKYCRETGEEYVKRFRREVRLLNEYKGNEKVVQLLDFDLSHDPPYFVMRYYEEGDLSNLIAELKTTPEKQEKIFLEMIDCIGELHTRNHYHRDIKPQNFLISQDGVIVSDFGLSMEIESNTAFTKSSMWWGTQGYLPPEFMYRGGFKNADAAGDIFMLGKSFYVLLSGREPMYLLSDDIEAPIFHVIERACATDKDLRYQSLAELKQSLVMAYDVILNRSGDLGKTQQLLSTINYQLEKEQKYSSSQIIEFIEKLNLLDFHDKVRICYEIDRRFYLALRQKPVVNYLQDFLNVYKEMVDNEDYGWSYAETIAKNMQVIFLGDEVPNKQKATALELAIDAAHRMNRFAAMDTCINMIVSITDNQLGIEIASVLLRNRHEFITSIEPSQCKSDPIRKAIKSMNQSKKNDI